MVWSRPDLARSGADLAFDKSAYPTEDAVVDLGQLIRSQPPAEPSLTITSAGAYCLATLDVAYLPIVLATTVCDSTLGTGAESEQEQGAAYQEPSSPILADRFLQEEP